MTTRFPEYDPADHSARANALASLMVTCALALDASQNWRSDVRRTAQDCIKNTLTLGAYDAYDLSLALIDPDEQGVKP